MLLFEFHLKSTPMYFINGYPLGGALFLIRQVLFFLNYFGGVGQEILIPLLNSFFRLKNRIILSVLCTTNTLKTISNLLSNFYGPIHMYLFCSGGLFYEFFAIILWVFFIYSKIYLVILQIFLLACLLYTGSSVSLYFEDIFRKILWVLDTINTLKPMIDTLSIILCRFCLY